MDDMTKTQLIGTREQLLDEGEESCLAATTGPETWAQDKPEITEAKRRHAARMRLKQLHSDMLWRRVIVVVFGFVGFLIAWGFWYLVSA